MYRTARIKKVKKTNLQSFRSVGSSKEASRESSVARVGGWIVQVPANDTWASARGLFHEVVVGTKQLLACPMAHYVPACTRINELPVHIAQRNATHVCTFTRSHVYTHNRSQTPTTVLLSALFPTPAVSIPAPSAVNLFFSLSPNRLLSFFAYPLLSFRTIDTPRRWRVFSFWLALFRWWLWKPFIERSKCISCQIESNDGPNRRFNRFSETKSC